MSSIRALLQQPFSSTLIIVLSCSLVALLTACVFQILIGMQSDGTEKMLECARMVRMGARRFLWRQSHLIIMCVAFVGGALYLFLDTTWAGMQTGAWQRPSVAASFIVGALCSVLTGLVGMRATMRAHVRTMNAARTGLRGALRIALISGAAAGLSVAGLGLLGITMSLLYFTEVAMETLPLALNALIGFSFGASVISFVARVRSSTDTDIGVQTVGADMDLTVIADNIQDSVINIVSMGADLFDSYVGTLVAAMLIASLTQWDTAAAIEATILFPLVVAALGIVASILGTFVVQIRRSSTNVQGALKNGFFFASALVIIGSFFFAQQMLPSDAAMGIFLSFVSGLIVGILFCILTEYATSAHHKPVHAITEASKNGASAVTIAGLAVGYGATVLPLLFLCLAIGIAYVQAGLYGIVISAVGVISTLGIHLALHAYATIVRAAGDVAHVAKLPKQVSARIDELRRAGSIVASIERTFAIGSAALTGIALFVLFTMLTRLESINLANPLLLISLLVGSVLPFACASMLIRPSHRKFATLRRMLMVGFIAIALPVLTGLFFGMEVLASVLVGSLVTGIVLAMSMVQSGGAWENARMSIASGHLGGKGSDCYDAAVIGDDIGCALKNASGPSITLLIKLMMIVSVLTVGLHSATGVF